VRIDIIPAPSVDQIAIARRLFREYEASLGIELTFQGFAQEVAGLPGAYTPPAAACSWRPTATSPRVAWPYGRSATASAR